MVLRKGSTSQFRKYDPFSKPKDEIRTRNSIGGLITTLASFTAISLFLSQIYIYYQVDTRHSFILTQSHPLSRVIPTEGGYTSFLLSSNTGDTRTSTSNKRNKNDNTFDLASTISFLTKNRMTISIHLTYPHLHCNDVDFSHDGASLSNGKFERYYGRNVITRRVPTEYEFYRATTGATDAQARAAGVNRRSKDNPNTMKIMRGCTMEGQVTVPMISGDLTFTMKSHIWQSAVGRLAMAYNMMQRDTQGSMGYEEPSWGTMAGVYNLTYFIHDISFGNVEKTKRKTTQSSKASPIGSTNPLHEAIGLSAEEPGISHTSLFVTLIPTRLERFARRAVDTYQASVGTTVIGAENLVRASSSAIAPGLSIKYDFSPLAVHHVESRENLFVFLSGLVGIVGGAFVTFGLVGRGLVSSASAVTKKID